MAPVSKCSVCKKSVTKNDMGVECSSCKYWLHASCVNIDSDLYAKMGNNDNLTYNCTGCIANNGAKKDSSSISKGFDELNKKFSSCFNTFAAEMRAEQLSLKALIETSITSIRDDFANSVNTVQKDLDKCNEGLHRIEQDTSKSINGILSENYKLHKRLNRGDIIISGLPIGINCLLQPILAICSHYKVEVKASDIFHCLYVQRGKAILVKFNNVFLRDRLMNEYFKNPTIALNDVIDVQLATRVYLNNNLTSEEVKLVNVCRTLRKSKIILWFKLTNGDVPLAKIKLADGSTKTIDFQQGVEMRES